MKTTWLQFCKYDEYGNCKITDFEISTDWLNKQITEPLEQFLNEYTSDEAVWVYELAILHGKILNENTNK